MELSTLELKEHKARIKRLSKILFEYLLVISPDRQTMEDISDFKRIFEESYGCLLAANLLPHLTLINFVQLEKNEEKIVSLFERFCSHVNPFNIQLNGFGEFQNKENKKVVYGSVHTKMPIINIVKSIRKSFRNRLKLDKEIPHFSLNPHITIARGMTDVQFHKAWPEWMDKKYNSTFPATEMLLLKREIIDGSYKQIARFQFNGNGSSSEQLKLALN